MGAAIRLRDDFDGAALRRRVRASRSADQTRRLLSLAVIYDGDSRTDAAKTGGVTLQIIRDWVLRFNTEGPDGLKTRHGGGTPPKLREEHLRFLADLVERGPVPAIDGVVRWRLCDLGQKLHETFGVCVDERTVGVVLRKMGYRKLSARPRHHAQNEFEGEAFKKTSERVWRTSGRASPRG